jgi:diguanylate cyclase
MNIGMDEAALMTGLLRGLAMSALIILAYSKVIAVTNGSFSTNIGVGVLFSAAGIVSMSDPLVLSPGILYDGRIPILALAYGFSGAIGVVLTTVAIGGYRLWLGGVGAASGLAAICIAAAAGIAVAQVSHRYLRSRVARSLLLGLAASTSTVAVILLPRDIWPAFTFSVLGPIVIANFIGVVMLNDFLSNEKRRLRLFRTLQHDAAVDPLTRLANRRAFDSKAESALAPGLNPTGDYAVIMIDIDHFKQVNDTYGHHIGDTVLAHIADTIRDAVRKTDIVARFGGEEIAVLLPGVDSEHATAIAEMIRQRIEAQQFPMQNGFMQVTISAGTAGSNIASTDIPSALRAADSALYIAKRTGRNKVETATEV